MCNTTTDRNHADSALEKYVTETVMAIVKGFFSSPFSVNHANLQVFHIYVFPSSYRFEQLYHCLPRTFQLQSHWKVATVMQRPCKSPPSFLTFAPRRVTAVPGASALSTDKPVHLHQAAAVLLQALQLQLDHLVSEGQHRELH